MKHLFIPFLLLLSFVFSCKRAQPETGPGRHPSYQEETLSMPVLTASSDPAEVAMIGKATIQAIDSIAEQSTKIETVLTVDGVEQTPVTVWYDNYQQPLKIQYGVPDDGGEFTGLFKIYLIKGKLWYADQIFAKYVFDETGHLLFWLDSNWNDNQIDRQSEDFKAREAQLLSTVRELVGKTALH